MAVPTEAIRALALDAVRDVRRDAQREESDLSYVRRILQGRIDILRAELGCRQGAAEHGGVLERLPEILADQPGGRPRTARHVTVHPPRTDRYRERIEELMADVELSDLAARTDAELGAALDRLTRYEQEVSARRQELQRTADDCGAEIARRYRAGEARVEDLLTGR